jgi:hypothetical protein
MTSPIYNTSKTVSYTLSNSTVNNDLDIGLVGDGYLGYGPIINTDLLKLLENFSNNTPPPKAINGQLWYDTANKQLKVYDHGLFSNIYVLPRSISVANLEVSETTTMANASVARLFTTTGIFWNANGNVFTSQATPGGSASTLQFNDNGYINGAFGLTTDGQNLNLAGNLNSSVANIDTMNINSGIYWSNGNVYTSGVSVTPHGFNGSIQFKNGSDFQGTSGVTTDGINVLISGRLSASGVNYPASLGTTGQFLQTDGEGSTAWVSIAGGDILGSGSSSQLASFNDTKSIQGTSNITTNGIDLTMAQGILTARTIVLPFGSGGGIRFPDGSIQSTASIANPSTVTGSGTAGQLSYFSYTNTVRGTSGISTNGTDLSVNGSVSIPTAPTFGAHATNKIYVDNILTQSKNYTDTVASTLATLSYVDGKLVPLASKVYVDNAISSINLTGGTVTGTGTNGHIPLWSSTSALKNSVLTMDSASLFIPAGINILLPTIPTIGNHVTNKQYVDDAIYSATSGLGGGGGTVSGTGSAGQLAYFKDASTVQGAASITTNGVNLTTSGSVQSNYLIGTKQVTSQVFSTTPGGRGSDGAFWQDVGNTGTKYFIWQGAGASSAYWDSTHLFTVNPNGVPMLAVTSAGLSSRGDITAYASSDLRLKTNIKSINNALIKVNSLNGITFNWNDLAEGKDTELREVGIIAQEVNEILPEVVTERDNGYLAVKYEKMVPLLIEAIKELSAKVDSLTEEINKLKN